MIVPTAGEADSYDQYWSGLQQFRENGARNLTVLHTRDPKVADEVSTKIMGMLGFPARASANSLPKKMRCSFTEF